MQTVFFSVTVELPFDINGLETKLVKFKDFSNPIPFKSAIVKTDIDLLIDQLQEEYNYLKAAMDDCVQDMDYECAQYYKRPFVYTNRKLNILKSLQNPNHTTIRYLYNQLENLEKIVENQEGWQRQHTSKKIHDTKSRLQNLIATSPKNQCDSDHILNLLSMLEHGKISQFQLPIYDNKLAVDIEAFNNTCTITIVSLCQSSLDQFIHEYTIPRLKELGFNTHIYQKEISEFRGYQHKSILELLAVLYFEVFDVYEKQGIISYK